MLPLFLLGIGKTRKATLIRTHFSLYTVVPVMNGHPRDPAKVSVHCRWPLVTGTDGQEGDAKYNNLAILHNTITTSDIPNEYTHCHNHQTTARTFEISVGRKFGCAPAIFGLNDHRKRGICLHCPL